MDRHVITLFTIYWSSVYFRFTQLGQNCGIVGSHAGVDINGVFWMSQDSFFLFDGSVKKLPCTVEQFIFNNLNVTGAENAFADIMENLMKLCGFTQERGLIKLTLL